VRIQGHWLTTSETRGRFTGECGCGGAAYTGPSRSRVRRQHQEHLHDVRFGCQHPAHKVTTCPNCGQHACDGCGLLWRDDGRPPGGCPPLAPRAGTGGRA